MTCACACSSPWSFSRCEALTAGVIPELYKDSKTARSLICDGLFIVCSLYAVFIPGSESPLSQVAHKLHVEFPDVQSFQVLSVEVDHISVGDSAALFLQADHLER